MLQELKEHLKSHPQSATLSGLRGSASAALIGQLSSQNSCCVIVPDENLVGQFEQDIRLFTKAPVLSYPGYEIPPYTPLSPDQQTVAARLSVLHRLQEQRSFFVLVVSVEAMMRRTVPAEMLEEVSELVMAENDCDRDQLINRLDGLGYERVALVSSVGDYSVRGGIIDVYPPTFTQGDSLMQSGPIRLDFFGDTIETIRCFDPVSQRSHSQIEEALLLPVHDALVPQPDTHQNRQIVKRWQLAAKKFGWDEDLAYTVEEKLARGLRFTGAEFFLPLLGGENQSNTSTLFDFLPDDVLLFFQDRSAIKSSSNLVSERILNNFSAAEDQSRPALPPKEVFLLSESLFEQAKKYRTLDLDDFAQNDNDTLLCNTNNHQLLKQQISLQRRKRGLLAPLTDQILKWQQENGLVIICCRSEKRTKNLAELLQKFHHTIVHHNGHIDLQELTKKHASSDLVICSYPLSQGFSLLEENIHCISENELFGDMRIGGKKKGRTTQKGQPVLFTELKEDDVVVHRDHGLGLYKGLVTMSFQQVKNDFMLLEYQDGDKLYLPVDRLNLITRYEGIADQQPKIDKLGTQSWKTTKAKVKEEVWKVAQDLLAIYAKREIQEGKRFSQPGELYRELEESFPFDETPGQMNAINETLHDLTSSTPTDRLICGDVGYGKTEVAIRAAFKVVEDGFQVAVLVPTTVLAEQHAKTFVDRLHGFPVNISCINRFRSTAEQNRILRELGAGKIDIIIGTHRLLSKDIHFNNLGLLIVDEEHRFGVSHKEKIKRMKAEVEILTLTATPIPRTLQMSLLGIRDLSVISSPPEQRRPVKTFVAQYDDLIIKEAVTKELLRGGQVFFVHNRVKSIQQMAAHIQTLVPGARIAVAHGQMGGNELEEIMVSFVSKEIDVLLCTTIIESGLDIPTANTIIIDRADRLGLAEIYQLRGRVGRSSLQSYAYLLVPSLEALSKDSKERLRALMDCNELGGGFKLAMSDLQIRGGGNLLGVSQSGNIAAIGYDLYLDLLQRTVADLKKVGLSTDQKSQQLEEFDPEINLQISAFIPQDYIADVSQRYVIYRRISALSNESQQISDELIDELEDRYGKLPAETENLFNIVALKKKLVELRISKMEKAPGSLVFSFRDDTPVIPEKLMEYINAKSTSKKRAAPRLTPDGRLIIPAEVSSIDTLFSTAGAIITDLGDLIVKEKVS